MTFAQLLFMPSLWEPFHQWLHFYADGSFLDFTQGPGTGDFCDLFCLQLIMTTLASKQDKSSRVQDCRRLLSKIPINVVFQWVPFHCGIWGNEMVNLLAKRSTDIFHRSTRDLLLYSTKLEINRNFKKGFRNAATSAAKNNSYREPIKPNSV
ncbi:hypothetical protein TNCV_4005771 [Trichonephila clavipes]|nr:hypothetical protein TNCV_4005771 [Trichonephila clavipes]